MKFQPAQKPEFAATAAEIKEQTNALVSEFLGFHTGLAWGHHNKAEVANAYQKMFYVIQYVREARRIIAKYTQNQWDCALIFGVGDTGVDPEDITQVGELMGAAQQIWGSNLFKKEA